MSTALSAFLIFVGVGIAVWLLSCVVEALRSVQQEPRKLRWAPELPIEHIEVNGIAPLCEDRQRSQPRAPAYTPDATRPVRKVDPRALQAVHPLCSRLSGARILDILKARYDATLFTRAVEGFFDKIDLRDVTLAGVSIGGAIALIVAARRSPRVARVVAINPYDDAKGRGMTRSSTDRQDRHLRIAPAGDRRDRHAREEFPQCTRS